MSNKGTTRRAKKARAGTLEKPAPKAPPEKGGRPRYVVDYTKLKALVGMFCSGVECASVLEVSYETLNERLYQDYEEAKLADPENIPIDYEPGFLEFQKRHAARGRASLRKAQFTAATRDKSPSIPMQIWLGKQVLEQKERVDHTSGDGTMSPGKPVEKLTREELIKEAEARGLPTTIFEKV